MRIVALAAALVLVAAGGAVWLVLRPAAPDAATESAASVEAEADVEAAGDVVRRHVRAPARERTPRARRDPLEADFDQVRASAAAGRPLEALLLLLALREQHPERFEGGVHDAWLLELQRAVPDAVGAALATLSRDEARALVERALAVVTDPDASRRLRRLALQVAGDVATREQVVVAGAVTPAERAALAAHLAHFGPLVPGVDRSAAAAGPLAERLARIRERAATRAKPVEPLPVADLDESERRRLDQLEKLRERGAVGLLGHIHAGLAWLALHQADDGRLSDAGTATRCAALGHAGAESCVESDQRYELAATALGALAFLDFRDQDAQALFEPTLSAAVSWLRSQIREDGSFPRYSYDAGIALMALGQAASSSGDPEVRADLERAWGYHAKSAAGGYRYQPGQAGDLSVTGWYAQAYETARDAEALLPDGLAPALATFVRSTWIGDHRFAYTPGTGPRWSLEPVGMLALSIVEPATVEPELEAWAQHLADADRNARLNLYALYYDVRMELALRGELAPQRRAQLDDFAALYQTTTGNAAGRFTFGPDKSLEKTWQKTAKRKPAVTGKDSWIARGGTTLFTAFSVLTLEHALYRR